MDVHLISTHCTKIWHTDSYIITHLFEASWIECTLWPITWKYSRFMKYPLSQLSTIHWISGLNPSILKELSPNTIREGTSELRKRDERNSKSSTNISHNLVIRIETYIVWLNSYSFSDFGWWFWTPWLSMMRSMIQRMTVNLYFYHKCVTSKRQMKLNDGQSRTTKYYPSGTHWLPILRWKCVII